MNALLVAGTTSDAGKSAVVAGLCRLLARRGVSVAPFKAQNMSNNSVVTVDGGEIGRAQALQAEAAGIPATVDLNPVLLKPGSDRTSQLIVRGRVRADMAAGDYHARRGALLSEVTSTLETLRSRYDVVICEGAGSPAEINLRGTDLANMGLARAAEIPVVVVGDIDRGGVLAHLAGTVGVLDAEDQALIAGFLINKFRGDPSLLAPGLDMLTELTGRPVLGVIPFLDQLWIDAEDSLGTTAGTTVGRPAAPVGARGLRVAAVRLPRVSNTTDIEALACEPGVGVTWVNTPAALSGADLVVIPGSRSTIGDLQWLRRSGLAEAIIDHAGAGGAVLGICGGFQMLGRRITDRVESRSPDPVAGLGLLDVEVRFAPEKTLRNVSGVDTATGTHTPVEGYEIHHGHVERSGEDPLLVLSGGPDEGARRGAVAGTHWHGLLASDDYRRRFLTDLARRIGATGFRVAPDASVRGERRAQLDLLADALEEHCDVDALLTLASGGVAPGLPGLTLRRSDRRDTAAPS
ncbi:MAG TPA: cobyric acid synthase [Candidatus Dietzia intestinipullorum]|nr:cobyric acid synthase [Candidatus Dietzia intestinipullorum]